MTTKSPEETAAFLTARGLSPTAPMLAGPAPEAPTTAKPVVVQDDPHTIEPVDIVFDPALLDGFPVLEGEGRNAASKYVFSLYRSNGRNKPRNSALHSAIKDFIGRVKRARMAGEPEGYVKGQVKTGKSQRDMAQLLAEHDIDEHDLAAYIASKKEQA